MKRLLRLFALIIAAALALSLVPAADAAEFPTFYDEDDIVLHIRQVMKDRKPSAVFYYTLPDGTDTGDWQESIWERVFAYTDDPLEGDYLFYSSKSFAQEEWLRTRMHFAVVDSDGSGTRYRVVITFGYWDGADADSEAALTASLEKSFPKELAGLDSDYEKIRGVWDFLAANVKNTGTEKWRSAPGTMLYGNVTKNGCALLAYRLLRSIGIDCYVVKPSPCFAAYNLVELDGLYYAVDFSMAPEGDYTSFLRRPGQFSHGEEYLKVRSRRVLQEKPLAEAPYLNFPESVPDKSVFFRYEYADGDFTLYILSQEAFDDAPNYEWRRGDYQYTTRIVISEGVTTIPDGCFTGYNKMVGAELREIVLPESLTYIGKSAIGGEMEELVIPDNVCYIGERAFANNPNLKSVTLGSSITEISKEAFANCSSLEQVTVRSEQLTSIGSMAFADCKSLRDVSFVDNAMTELSGSTIEIGPAAFYRCTGLESVRLSDAVKTIGDGAFTRCENLKVVTLRDGLKSIGGEAFANCSALENMIIPETVASLGEGAFNMAGIRNIVIPKSLDYSSLNYTVMPNIQRVWLPGRSGINTVRVGGDPVPAACPYLYSQSLAFKTELGDGSVWQIADYAGAMTFSATPVTARYINGRFIGADIGSRLEGGHYGVRSLESFEGGELRIFMPNDYWIPTGSARSLTD